MKKIISTVTLTILTFISSLAVAGGIIPQNYGMKQGSYRMVPASPSLIRWDYSGVADQEMRDVIMWAIATLDNETLKYRLLFGTQAEAAASEHTHVRFRFDDHELDSGCLPNDPDPCEYAIAQCLSYTSTTGIYKRCSSYRVTIHVNNIEYRAEQNGLDHEEKLDWYHAIFRHEYTHVLGFSHSSDVVPEGPMVDGNLPLTQCQLDVLDVYTVSTALSIWMTPTSCIQMAP